MTWGTQRANELRWAKYPIPESTYKNKKYEGELVELVKENTQHVLSGEQ